MYVTATLFEQLGSRQVVRHLPLEQAFGGSNPSSPAMPSLLFVMNSYIS